VRFRNTIVTAIGEKQNIAEDPAGSLFALLEPIWRGSQVGREGVAKV